MTTVMSYNNGYTETGAGLGDLNNVYNKSLRLNENFDIIKNDVHNQSLINTLFEILLFDNMKFIMCGMSLNTILKLEMKWFEYGASFHGMQSESNDSYKPTKFGNNDNNNNEQTFNINICSTSTVDNNDGIGNVCLGCCLNKKKKSTEYVYSQLTLLKISTNDFNNLVKKYQNETNNLSLKFLKMNDNDNHVNTSNNNNNNSGNGNDNDDIDDYKYNINRHFIISLNDIDDIRPSKIININDGIQYVVNHLKKFISPHNPIIHIFSENTKTLYQFFKDHYSFIDNVSVHTVPKSEHLVESKTDDTVKLINVIISESTLHSNIHQPNMSFDNSSNNNNIIRGGNNDNTIITTNTSEMYNLQLFLRYKQKDGNYCVISGGSSTINFYNKDATLLNTFNIDLISCGGIYYSKNERLYFIGTHYGILYIYYNNDFHSMLYFGAAIKKIKVIGTKYIVFTNQMISVLSIGRKNNILISSIDISAIDADIMLDTLVVLFKNKNGNYIKFHDLTKKFDQFSTMLTEHYYNNVKSGPNTNSNNKNNKNGNSNDNNTTNSTNSINTSHENINNSNKNSKLPNTINHIQSNRHDGYCIKLPQTLFENHNELNDKIETLKRFGVFQMDNIFFDGSTLAHYKNETNHYSLSDLISSVIVLDYSGKIVVCSTSTIVQ